MSDRTRPRPWFSGQFPPTWLAMLLDYSRSGDHDPTPIDQNIQVNRKGLKVRHGRRNKQSLKKNTNIHTLMAACERLENIIFPVERWTCLKFYLSLSSIYIQVPAGLEMDEYAKRWLKDTAVQKGKKNLHRNKRMHKNQKNQVFQHCTVAFSLPPKLWSDYH